MLPFQSSGDGFGRRLIAAMVRMINQAQESSLATMVEAGRHCAGFLL